MSLLFCDATRRRKDTNTMTLLDDAKQFEAMTKALKWYQERAEALADPKRNTTVDYTCSVLKELELDGGKRAKEALE